MKRKYVTSSLAAPPGTGRQYLPNCLCLRCLCFLLSLFWIFVCVFVCVFFVVLCLCLRCLCVLALFWIFLVCVFVCVCDFVGLYLFNFFLASQLFVGVCLGLSVCVVFFILFFVVEKISLFNILLPFLCCCV